MTGNQTAQAIEAHGVSKIFRGPPDVYALDDVSVTIGKNEFFTLLGPSGCGKTTLLRLIAGFEHPTKGRITLNGEEISHLPPYKRPVNTVFQNYALFPHLSVADNIGFGLEMLGKPRAEVTKAVDDMLKLVRMEALKTRATSEISGGQQQRVALARALAPHPEVLLLDEPLSALDLKLRKEMQIELKRLQNETGITFVFVTHDQEEALTMSDRIAVMSEGKILQVGTPREIYEHPAERFVANFIGESNFLGAELLGGDGATGRARVNGYEFDASLPTGAPPPGPVSILVRPEHARIATDGPGIAATVGQIVYFGTDTHYRLDLGQGDPFVVRVQNLPNDTATLGAGDRVMLSFAERAPQVMRD